MAVLRNNTVFPRHESYGGGQSWAASSSSFLCMVSVSGLWWSNIRPVPIKCSTSTQAWRGSHCRSLWSSASNPSFSAKQTPKANAEKHVQGQRQQDEEDDEEEEEYQVLTSIRSQYNDIMILDTAKSRVLLLDSSHNVHSILYKHQNWTNAYWDEFASLPPIVPKGPIAILGLGAGTAAHLMLDLWPELQLKGWEIDQILIYQAREYFGLSDLEKHTKAGGNLTVHIGDALSPSVKISGGYAGIVVDLFSNGEVLPQLQEVTTWLDLNNWLMPNGRIIVNCGGTSGASEVDPKSVDRKSFSDGSWVQNSTIKALSIAFPGQISWKRMPKDNGANFLALTGPMPDLDSWSTMVPEPLSANVKQWRPCEEIEA